MADELVLSDFAIAEVHCGLEIPSDGMREAMCREIIAGGASQRFDTEMAREVRRQRGVPNPDVI